MTVNCTPRTILQWNSIKTPFSFKKMFLKMLFARCWPLCSGLVVLNGLMCSLLITKLQTFWGYLYTMKRKLFKQDIYSLFSLKMFSVYCIVMKMKPMKGLTLLVAMNVENAVMIFGVQPANERWRYNVRSSLIGWAHWQNDPWECSICCTSGQLTHCGLVTPYGDRGLGQHWLR